MNVISSLAHKVELNVKSYKINLFQSFAAPITHNNVVDTQILFNTWFEAFLFHLSSTHITSWITSNFFRGDSMKVLQNSTINFIKFLGFSTHFRNQLDPFTVKFRVFHAKSWNFIHFEGRSGKKKWKKKRQFNLINKYLFFFLFLFLS